MVKHKTYERDSPLEILGKDAIAKLKLKFSHVKGRVAPSDYSLGK